MKLQDIITEKNKGLWANIHAKKKRGEKSDPRSKSYKAAVKAGKKIRKQNEELTEAEMDRQFAKEFESNCKAFVNHIKHELKTAEGSDKTVLQKMLKNLLVVSGYPKLMSRIVGEK
tara:strand:+ start:9200 stop:9547 length:348 start_codon:yes stop_codon:yes gene_type:complete